MLLVDRYDDDWSKLGWVALRGRATIITGGAGHATALRTLRARYPPYRAMNLEERDVIEIRIESATSWGRLEPT